MSWRRRQQASANSSPSSSSSSSPSCLLDLIASTWVDLYHAAFVNRKSLEQENERIRMSAVQRDLDKCYSMLQQREAELQMRVSQLGRQAIMYKQGKNLAGARKKMLERARVQAQMEKIQNSILMIEMHRSTLEGTAMDISVLETLKASGDALRQMGVTGQGLRAVEDLVSGLEESMQSAAEITQVLSTGSVSGVVNSMAAFGTAIDEDELMRELDDMTLDESENGSSSSSSSIRAGEAAAVAASVAVPTSEAASGHEMAMSKIPWMINNSNKNVPAAAEDVDPNDGNNNEELAALAASS